MTVGKDELLQTLEELFFATEGVRLRSRAKNLSALIKKFVDRAACGNK